MIAGILAQESLQPPHGTIAGRIIFVDEDVFFRSIITSGDDQRVFPELVDGDDDFLVPECPIVLMSDAIYQTWLNPETIFKPTIIRDQVLLPSLYVAGDIIIINSDIRVPGHLLPWPVDDTDTIFPTPLILDRGMLRSELHYDYDAFFSTTIQKAETLFPGLVTADDAFNTPSIIAGAISPPFISHDDEFFAFATQTVFRPARVIDSAIPVHAPTTFDGVSSNTIISSDGLTASVVTGGINYSGARSTLCKDKGKYYWEVTVGPTHGRNDAAGILLDVGSYLYMASGTTTTSLAVYVNYLLLDDRTGLYAAGSVISGNAWYAQLASARARPWPNTVYGYLEDGDVIGMAVDLDNRKAWFRLNGGHWNNDQFGSTFMPDQDPESGIGGVPIAATGKFGPAVEFGAIAGSLNESKPGDNFTANFGLRAYQSPAPNGFIDLEIASPFGPSIGGDSFGRPSIGIPSTLNGANANVVMSNGNLTATHNNLNDNSGAMSASVQNYGRYYFEVTIGISNGQNDTVGIALTDALFSQVANGVQCAIIYVPTGNIWSANSYTGTTLGPLLAGDVIGVAVDLTGQTNTFGGNIWFRKKRSGVISNWNNDASANPVTGAGGAYLLDYSYIGNWVPWVGFSGGLTQVGDNMTANFGATAYAMPPPDAFAIWSTTKDLGAIPLQPSLHDSDDVFYSPSCDTANKLVWHSDYVRDADTIFPATSHGGTLMLYSGLVADVDVVYRAGNYTSFTIASPQISLSNKNLTVMQTGMTPNIWARSRDYRFAGKYYFEVTCVTTDPVQNFLGVATENATVQNLLSSGTNCCGYLTSGIIESNMNFIGGISSPVNGDVIALAIDLDFRKGWIRKNSGLWNATVGADPDSNIGGFTIAPSVSFAPVIAFGASYVNDAYTANFGTSAFVQTPPMSFGFWPGESMSKALTAPLMTDSDTFPAPLVRPANLLPGLVASDDAFFLFSGTGGIPTIGSPVYANDDAIFATAISPVVASFTYGLSVNAPLSNNNLTATHSTNTSDSGARGGAIVTTGKHYFEVTMTAVHGAYDCVGILSAAGTYANLVTAGTNCAVVYRNTGAIYSNNGSSGKTLSPIAAGDVIGVAIDLAARKAWFHKNGGSWNGDITHNPATGAGGVTIAATVGFQPAIGFGGTGTAVNDAMTVNFGSTTFQTAAPTGFSIWPDYVSILATLDGTITDVSLSNGNRTATHTSTAAAAGARSTTAKTSGKYYFEATLGATHGATDAVGLISSIGTFTDINNGTHGVICFFANGNVLSTYFRCTLGAVAAGNVLGFAIDLDARLGWIRKGAGNWNADVSANPATGAGGFQIEAVPESFAPVVAFGSGQAGDNVTVNYGQVSFVNAAPSGFGQWKT